MHDLLKELAKHIVSGDAAQVTKGVEKALTHGFLPFDILNKALMAGMDEVGQGFQEGDLFIPELIVAARAMHAGIEVLKPHLVSSESQDTRKFVLGTVQGDLHDIGKKLVGIMMQGAGFQLIDLGHNVAPEKFVEAVNENQPEIVGMSALLSTTMPMMKATIEALQKAGCMANVKVLIGGAPITQAFCNEIGAHGYAKDAVAAVSVAKALLEIS